MPITFLPQNIGFIIMGMSTRAHYPRSRSISEYRGYTWVIDVFSFLFLLSLFYSLGTLRSDDGDGNRNTTTILHVHHAFLYISLPSLHDYDVKMPNFTMYRKYKSDDEISSLFLTVNMVLRNSALGYI